MKLFFRALFVLFVFMVGYAPIMAATPTITVTNSEPVMSSAGTLRGVDIIATVTGSFGTPTGTITFSINGQNQATVSLANGSAKFLASLEPGDYSIIAKYSGDANYSANNGTLTLSLPKYTQSISLGNNQPVIYGQDSIISYIPVRISGGLVTHSVAGGVTVYIDGVLFSQSATDFSNAVRVPKPSAGSHTFLIVLEATANYSSASLSGNFSVEKGSVSITISANRNTVLFGQGVDFTATVTPKAPSPGPVTGTVTFRISGNSDATVNMINGVATYSATSFQPGTYSITAIYNGSKNFNSSDFFMTPITLNARCGVVLSGQVGNFTETGGTKTISVSAPAECDWKASSDSSWLGVSITSSSLTYTAQPLIATSQRTGKLTIDDLQYTVIQQGTTPPLSSATYSTAGVAAEQIVTCFGVDLADSTAAATSLPLPTTLAGLQIKVRDSKNVERLAPLFYVSPTQVNHLIPSGTATGNATINFYKNGQLISSVNVTIKSFVPGIYTATQDGLGAAAALTQKIKANGTQVYAGTAQYNPELGTYSMIPIDLGDGTELTFLLLFGTGIRGISTSSVVTATVGAQPAQVTYAGAQGQYEGLDQINIKLPFSLKGNGLADVKVFVDGVPMNTVQVRIK